MGIFGLRTFREFNRFDNSKGDSNAIRTYDKDTDGVMLTFKPRLFFDETGVSDTSAGNRSVFHYFIDIDANKTVNHYDDSVSGDLVSFVSDGTAARINRRSLRLMDDLTGCYLVSEAGKYINETNSVATYSHNVVTPISLDEMSPTTIAYVLSHEIDTTNTNLRHIITTDKALPNGFYRIMQPNHVCMYNYSPKELSLIHI